MRYYHVKYTDDIPVGFGGQAKGPFIRIAHRYLYDQGLLEHEKTHVRQWWGWFLGVTLLALAAALLLAPGIGLPFLGWAPFMHQVIYRCCRPYRQWAEVRAYRIQLRTGHYASAEFAVDALAFKYRLRLTKAKARALLRL